jgi:hypothetical protein
VLHREREQHDADDQQEMRVRIRVPGDRNALCAPEVDEQPRAADREEVEIGEPERRGDADGWTASPSSR